MVRMRIGSLPIRFAWAALLAALLALRSLAPAGFMPAFHDGTVIIVACPDADGGSREMAMHHHGDHKSLHEQCPYASASALGALAPELPALSALIVFAATLLLGRSFLSIKRQTARERPPATGPPIPA